MSIDFEEHLLDVSDVHWINRGLALVRNLDLKLEKAVQFLPQEEGLFTRDLLQDKSHAVCEGSQSDVFLVLRREGVQNLLFDHWERLFHVLKCIVHDLGELGDQLPFWQRLRLL